MSEQDKQWLIEEFPKYRGRILRGEVLDSYYKAEKILKNLTTIKKRGCSCEYKSLGIQVDNLYEKFIERLTV